MKRLSIKFTDGAEITLNVDDSFSLFDEKGAFQQNIDFGLMGRAADGREFYVKSDDIRSVAVRPVT